MRATFSRLLAGVYAGSALASTSAGSPYQYNQDHGDDHDIQDVITRDVAIIGGGSAGTYAAISLRRLNHSVVVVEKKGRLGGHTETYHDPVTQTPIDIGVVLFDDIDVVKDYFAYFNVPLTKTIVGSDPANEYVDLQTGKLLAGYQPPSAAAVGAALQAYGAELAKYPYLASSLNLPDPVPPDLYNSFGDFVHKYKLENVTQTLAGLAQGYGDVLSIPALYLLKVDGPGVVQGLQNGFLTTVRQDNSEIYEKATAALGSDALLNSTVVWTNRDKDSTGYITLVVQTPDGKKKIRAKQLVVAIPPLLRSLSPLDLADRESSLFRQFTHSNYYTGILRNSGLPPNISVSNIGANTPYNLPVLPGSYAFYPTGVPDLTNVKYGSPDGIALSDEEVQANILKELTRLRETGAVNFTTPAGTQPTFAVYSNHSPFALKVNKEAIKAGFYRSLYGLQGFKNTWWTGAAWNVHDSGLTWQFTQGVVAELVKQL